MKCLLYVLSKTIKIWREREKVYSLIMRCRRCRKSPFERPGQISQWVDVKLLHLANDVSLVAACPIPFEAPPSGPGHCCGNIWLWARQGQGTGDTRRPHSALCTLHATLVPLSQIWPLSPELNYDRKWHWNEVQIHKDNVKPIVRKHDK